MIAYKAKRFVVVGLSSVLLAGTIFCSWLSAISTMKELNPVDIDLNNAFGMADMSFTYGCLVGMCLGLGAGFVVNVIGNRKTKE